MRLDVAGAAGIAVVAPGAAHVVGALEDDEVVDPVPLQLNGGAEAAEPTAYDGDTNVVAVDAVAGRRHGRALPSRWGVQVLARR